MNSAKFDLWSPPTLDLSLDSFSNDIFKEFEKKAGSKNINEAANEYAISPSTESHHNQVTNITDTANTTTVDVAHSNVNYVIPMSPVPSSVTLPQSERETVEEATSTTNLFRRSSTFLKNKLSLNTGDANRNSTASNLSTQQVEDISSVISRQYPPKPLQYSPIVDPPSDDIKIIQTSSPSSGVVQQEEKKPLKDRTPKAPKKRTFFSLRFC